MRRLLLAAAAPLLLAQGAHYEGGMLIAPAIFETTIRLPRHPESVSTLAFTTPDGHTRTLALPPELDGRLGRCEQIEYLQGTAYAIGFRHVPLPPGKASREAYKQDYFRQPRDLFACGPDGRWTRLARLQDDVKFRRWRFLPLGEGRFLYGQDGFAWNGDAVSPFGIYRVEDSRLKLERLLDLGLGGPWYQAVPFPPGTVEARRYGKGPQVTEAYRDLAGDCEDWRILRLPVGLCLLHGKSRRWFLLDGQATHCLGQGRLGGTEPEEMLAAAVRPDGRVLVVTQSGSPKERLEAWIARSSTYNMPHPVPRPAEELLIGRAEALRPPLLEQERIVGTWRVLDPVQGRAWDVEAPRNLRISVIPFRTRLMDMTVLPNGSLRISTAYWFLQRPSRLRYDWLDRLLKPFTHDWRKLEP